MAKAMIQTALAVAAQVAIEVATKDKQQESVAVALFATPLKLPQQKHSHKRTKDHGIPCRKEF